MRTALIVPFLNEAGYLPGFLDSIERQTVAPEAIYLVDDGSTDGSSELAAEFAARHAGAQLVQLPVRPPVKDRLAQAAELVAFHVALEMVDPGIEVVAKLDADLVLVPDHVETMLAAFTADPELGIAAGFLVEPQLDGSLRRQRHPVEHTPGPNKFYRRDCLEQIEPLPEILGWDGFDGIRARGNGWTTRSVACPSGDSVHRRPTGMHDGILRAYRRWGVCAWGWGAHPVYVLVGGLYRVPNRPYVVGGLSYIWGYVAAALSRRPRVDPWTRDHAQREEKTRLRGLVSAGVSRTTRRTGRLEREETSHGC